MTRGVKGAQIGASNSSCGSGGATGGANLILRRLANTPNLLQ